MKLSLYKLILAFMSISMLVGSGLVCVDTSGHVNISFAHEDEKLDDCHLNDYCYGTHPRCDETEVDYIATVSSSLSQLIGLGFNSDHADFTLPKLSKDSYSSLLNSSFVPSLTLYQLSTVVIQT